MNETAMPTHMSAERRVNRLIPTRAYPPADAASLRVDRPPSRRSSRTGAEASSESRDDGARERHARVARERRRSVLVLAPASSGRADIPASRQRAGPVVQPSCSIQLHPHVLRTRQEPRLERVEVRRYDALLAGADRAVFVYRSRAPAPPAEHDNADTARDPGIVNRYRPSCGARIGGRT